MREQCEHFIDLPSSPVQFRRVEKFVEFISQMAFDEIGLLNRTAARRRRKQLSVETINVHSRALRT